MFEFVFGVNPSQIQMVLSRTSVIKFHICSKDGYFFPKISLGPSFSKLSSNAESSRVTGHLKCNMHLLLPYATVKKFSIRSKNRFYFQKIVEMFSF